ncbi:hypothetical protein GO011_08250 [Mycobacterium sp. 20091114027_K0903767]|nr:hypothetical protein [Mycobacterium sp. 20091114027_K0903767]
MTETATIHTRWAANPVPYSEDAEVIVSAWTRDVDLARHAVELAEVYGNRGGLLDVLHIVRGYLRGFAMDTASAAVLVQSVLDGGVAELVTASTTDTELDAIAVAAEAGHGAPIPELREELGRLRDAERTSTTPPDPSPRSRT